VVARSLKRLGNVEPAHLAGMQREAFLWAHEPDRRRRISRPDGRIRGRTPH
jgi:hypothetical protein